MNKIQRVAELCKEHLQSVGLLHYFSLATLERFCGNYPNDNTYSIALAAADYIIQNAKP